MTVSIHERLRKHWFSVEGVAVDWGVSDCTAWVASWIADRGIDIAPLPYRSRADAMRMIVRAGSLRDLWDEWLTPAGVFEAGIPQVGDVGILDTASHGQIGGIWAESGGFFWRTENAATFLRPRQASVVKSWSLECGN